LRKRAEKRYPALKREKLQGSAVLSKRKIPKNHAYDNSIENFAVKKSAKTEKQRLFSSPPFYGKIRQTAKK
jgi:hypothetical protein